MPNPSSLTDLEWSAVAVAFQDAARCGCATVNGRSSVMGRLVTALFGQRKPNGLADPRLEAVRRFVCSSRQHGQIANDVVAALAEHGFSPTQIAALALLSNQERSVS